MGIPYTPAIALFMLPGFALFGRTRKCVKSIHAPRLIEKLSIIIPARNEQSNLPRLLKSIANQPYQPQQVIVVDDNSSDGTARVAVENRATLISLTHKPIGWTGKTWACFRGAQAATGSYLLFIDADLWFEPDSLLALMGEYDRLGGVLSVLPYNHPRKWFQNGSLFLSIFQAAGVMAFSPFRRNDAWLFGQCMLCDTNDYFRIGGHEIVKDQVLEHFTLGQAFRQHGSTLHTFSGTGVLSTSTYAQGLPDLIDGWSKSIALGAQRGSKMGLLFTVIWIGGCCLSFFGIRRAWRVPLSKKPQYLIPYFFQVMQVLWIQKKLGNYHWVTAFTYPVAMAFAVFVFLLSLTRVYLIRKVRWHGREVSIEENG